MKCPYCEKEIQDNSVFCYECGEQIYLSVEISDAAGIIASAVYWHMYSGNMENGDINRLKLAYMRLEDREIKGACEVFEKLLEENAENGWAHFGLFLADQMENGRGKFVPDIIYDNNSYTRGARFEGEQFKSIVDEAIKEVFYQSGLKAMKEIEEPQEYITIARTFRDKLDGYKDSGAQSRNCEYLYNKFFYDEYIAEAATADTEEKL
ncbi:MAG: zinc ribbon domain-containing protein, partial [Abditibacteriota bacterium]|nr:zinc ribbon domain-containing protein [Abditibacteriota bacterium]